MLEIIGFIIALSSVWLVIKQRRTGWLLSILSGFIYIAIYGQAKLYSDAELQLLYIAVAIYGYHNWRKKKNAEAPVIHLAPTSSFILYITTVLLMTIVWGALHSWMTDASWPYLDALLATTCIVAQWMTHKYFQCWYLWIFANIGYIWMYAAKGLTTTTLLYVIFFVVTMNGYREWKRTLNLTLLDNNLT